MTTMINRTSKTGNGGPNPTPIVSVTVAFHDADSDVPTIDRVTIVPTTGYKDANEQYDTNVCDYVEKALHVEHMGESHDPYRVTCMRFTGATTVTVERF